MENNMTASCYTCYPGPSGLAMARIYWEKSHLRSRGPMRQVATVLATINQKAKEGYRLRVTELPVTGFRFQVASYPCNLVLGNFT
jgi:hypothetical protein